MMQMDIFVQARMSSTRLPGKVLKPVGGIPLLHRTYNRIRQSKGAENVAIITSTHNSDDLIVDYCVDNKIPIIRGDLNDLLDRHYKAALSLGSDYVFKIPSDCPFADHILIDRVLAMAADYDYVSNYHPPTFPDGLDVEGACMTVLHEAWCNAQAQHEREHTFPYIWDQPNKYTIGNLVNEHGNMFMTHRWTLDYLEDFKFVEAVYREFDYTDDFGFTDILDLLHDKPDIAEINKAYAGVNWYRNEAEKLKTVDKSLYRQPSLEV